MIKFDANKKTIKFEVCGKYFGKVGPQNEELPGRVKVQLDLKAGVDRI